MKRNFKITKGRIIIKKKRDEGFKKLKIVIADNEEIVRESLAILLEESFPELIISALTSSVQETIEVIRKENPDIVLLDVGLSEGTGLKVVEAIKSIDFEVIFITDYSELTIETINRYALDYLLKPLKISELIKTIQKIINKRLQSQAIQAQNNVLKDQFNKHIIKKIFLPTESGLEFVDINDIIRCEADRKKTIFYMNSGRKIITSKSIHEYETLLTNNNFFLVHNSHIVNLNHVKRYIRGKGGSVIMSDGAEVEVSIRRKSEFLDSFVNMLDLINKQKSSL